MVRRGCAMWAIWLFLAATPAHAQSTRIQALLDGVDPVRIRADVEALSALHTRFALSPEFWRATDLVKKRLQGHGLLPVLDPFMAGPALVNNVIVTLPGSVPGRPVIIASAHYDSITFDADTRSPGAEDNASGTAGLLEMARALAGQRLAAEVRLIFFAAEEEGRWGSKHLVSSYSKSGGLSRVGAVINMDMIGHDPLGKREMVVDSFPVSRGLAGRIQAAALAYTRLVVYVDIFSPGRSDHGTFAMAGVPAVNLASATWHNYTAYHTGRDTPDQVDPAMVALVTRANLATILRLSGFQDGPPVAHGGDQITAQEGDRITLRGGASFDPQGKALSFAWRQIGGTDVALNDAALKEPAFAAEEPGAYRFELKVTSSDGRVSEPDWVGVVVEDGGGCAVGAGGGEGWWLILIGVCWLRSRSRSRPTVTAHGHGPRSR